MVTVLDVFDNFLGGGRTKHKERRPDRGASLDVARTPEGYSIVKAMRMPRS